MNSPVDSTHPDWNAWATLANDVGGANRESGSPMSFTERHTVARALWDMGYRPPEGARSGVEVATAVRALHAPRETPVYDEDECTEGDCGHEPGTCVILTPSVCGHCADQTEPGDAWEHMVREDAFWPCATIRALTDPAGALPKHDAEVWEAGYRFASGRKPLPGYNPYGGQRA